MATTTNGRSARTRKFVTRRGVELHFTELGFGGAPLGNLYRPMTEKEARRDARHRLGVRLSLFRYRTALRPRAFGDPAQLVFCVRSRANSYLISTKVGRLLELCKPHERSRQDGAGAFFETPVASRALRLFL